MNNTKPIHWTTALKAMKEMTPPDSRNLYMRPQRSVFSPYEFVNQDGTGGSIVVSVCPDTGSPSFIGYRDKNGSLYLSSASNLTLIALYLKRFLSSLHSAFVGRMSPRPGGLMTRNIMSIGMMQKCPLTSIIGGFLIKSHGEYL